MSNKSPGHNDIYKNVHYQSLIPRSGNMFREAVCDGIDFDWIDDTSGMEGEAEWYKSAPVKYFTNEVSCRGRLRRLLLRNPTTRLGSRGFDLVVKTLMCILYVVRAQLDDLSQYDNPVPPCDDGELVLNTTDLEDDNMVFSTAYIHWHVLLWVHRPLPLWIIEVVLSVFTFFKYLLEIFVSTKGISWQLVLNSSFIIEVVCSVPMVITVCYPPATRNLFVPLFLNCWLAKLALQKLFNDLHLTRQRFQAISVTLSQQILILVVTILCIIYTTICGMQHIQRGSVCKPLTMWESLYFVIVTFSTVGYGDISPDIWLGQLFIMIMICVAFAFIPRQLEGIGTTWLERQKSGGEYSRQQSAGHRHVVVCSSSLTSGILMDFLMEFYAHSKLEDHMVVIMSSEDLDTSILTMLKDPKWSHRVIYMHGSALKELDLQRCRIQEADACFIMAPRTTNDRDLADQHTILRSWAVKDFAPGCRQYIQLFKTENKIHVKFAEHVVCEDEFKYALLANNCLYPGLSTLVTLLMHTMSGSDAGEVAKEPWQQIYGRHSGNEVYHIQLSKSIVFKSYQNKTFSEASASAHEKFGFCLVAILDMAKPEPQLQLNPGPDYKLKETDYCFYLGETKEEYVKITDSVLNYEATIPKDANQADQMTSALELWIQRGIDNDSDDEEDCVFNNTISGNMGKELLKQVKTNAKDEVSAPSGDSEETSTEPDTIKDADDLQTGSNKLRFPFIPPELEQNKIMIGPPPVTLMCVGNRRTQCHLSVTRRSLCCLKWGEDCDHCTFKNANDERWEHQLIILSAPESSNGVYNFIIPLRSHFIKMTSISPIIILLETEPKRLFLETISSFPLVYWMQGSIKDVDDLLRAGITKASHLVVVNRPARDNYAEESPMTDAETVVAVQTIFKLFPNANIITELSEASNIRFMQFLAQDEYSRKVSQMEKDLRLKMSSNMSHIYRLPFAAGQVFSASMLDSLLYQTFVKGYLITFVRLLLGIDAEKNSGHLSSIKVKRVTVAHYSTYGELYKALSEQTGEIPIAIYRTEKRVFSYDPSSAEVTVNNNFAPTKRLTRAARMSFPTRAFLGKDTEQPDFADVVRHRLTSLGMKDDYGDEEDEEEEDDKISYIIVNPTPKRKLKIGDIVYVIQPSSMTAVAGRTGRQSRAKRISRTSESDSPMPASRSTIRHSDISEVPEHQVPADESCEEIHENGDIPKKKTKRLRVSFDNAADSSHDGEEVEGCNGEDLSKYTRFSVTSIPDLQTEDLESQPDQTFVHM